MVSGLCNSKLQTEKKKEYKETVLETEFFIASYLNM